MKLGVQLYTVREQFQSDPAGTLKKVGETGVRYAESYGYNGDAEGVLCGFSSAEIRAMADEAGIRIVSSHIWADDVREMLDDKARMDRIVEFNVKLGSESVILAAQFFTGKEDVDANCGMFNEIGKRCLDAGIRFMYHNHFWEFQEVDGNVILDLLLENTDPNLVSLQMDAYWVRRAMYDPVGLLERYGGRVKSLHQKDFPKEHESELNIWRRVDKNVLVSPTNFENAIMPEDFTEIGCGIMDIQGVIDAGNRNKIPYLMLEQDFSARDPLTSVKISMDAFRTMRGIELE